MFASEDLTCDRLVGSWHVWQLRRGHRFSTDDMLTAWLAADLAPRARDVLDLGAGIGSVGLMTLWRLPVDARLTMVEAQDVSHALARRTVELNALGERVTLRHGDLRDPASVPERDRFDLVTGSPPYMPVGNGGISPHPQRAACRVELRGTIADYALTAARAMAPDGWFVACFPAIDPRGERAFADAGLHLRVKQDVVFRHGQPPMIVLLAGKREPGPLEVRPPVQVRDPEGRWTDMYQALRASMGAEVTPPGAPPPGAPPPGVTPPGKPA